MKMIVAPDFCIRPSGAECERCRIACPVSAISFENETSAPSIDAEACTKCGLCMGVCDAFTSSSTSMHALYEHLRRVAMRGEVVYLTCKENVFPGFTPAKNVTVLPCLACMPPELWALLLAQNVPLCLACDLKYCDDCDKAPGRGEMLFTRAIEMAEEWTGGEVHWDREIPEYEEQSLNAGASQFGRREAFDSIAGDAIDIVTGKRRLKNSDTLKDIYRKKERKRMQDKLNLLDGEIINKFAENGRSKRTLQPRRRMLLEAAVAHPALAQNVHLAVSETDRNLCVDCLDCTKCCPTGARMASPENGTLDYEARFCIGCGACLDVCPREAIDLVVAPLSEIAPDLAEE